MEIDQKYYQFLTCDKYRFRVTDEHGDLVNLTKLKLTELINTNTKTEFHYDVKLAHADIKKYRSVMALYKKNKNEIIFYSLSESDKLRITLKCDSLKKAEELIDLVCEGENLQVVPVHKSNFN